MNKNNKLTINFDMLWYVSFAMALLTVIPSIGTDSVPGDLSSGIFLFLEGMGLVFNLMGIFFSSWFLLSKTPIVTAKIDSNFKSTSLSLGISRLNFVLLFFLIIMDKYPNQKQLVVLLCINSILRLTLTLLSRKAVAKAKKINNPN